LYLEKGLQTKIIFRTIAVFFYFFMMKYFLMFVGAAGIFLTGCSGPASSDQVSCSGDATTCEVEASVTEMPEFYQPYSAEKFAAVRGQRPVALFFRAGWCSTCVKLEKKIFAAAADFPENAQVLVVDFDSAPDELKQEFGVTKQSSVVLLDADGEHFSVEVNPPVATIVSHFQ